MRWVIPLVYLPTLLTVAIALLLLPSDLPASFLTRDPASIAGKPAFFGLFSNIGVLLWCSTAAICLFSAAILKSTAKHRKASILFFACGCFTALLMLDDLFLFHERLYPRFLFGETVAYSLYAVILVFMLLRFRSLIANTDFILLSLALALLGLSVTLDILLEADPYLLEAGSKFLGIASWFAYWTRCCWQELRTAIVTWPTFPTTREPQPQSATLPDRTVPDTELLYRTTSSSAPKKAG